MGLFTDIKLEVRYRYVICQPAGYSLSAGFLSGLYQLKNGLTFFNRIFAQNK